MNGLRSLSTDGLPRGLRNLLAVARREFISRGRTRTFKWATVFLVVAGVLLASAPVIIQFFDRTSTGDRVEVVVGSTAPSVDVVLALNQILNASSSSTIGGSPSASAAPAATAAPAKPATPDVVVVAATDLATARAHVGDGSSVAVLALTRDSAGDLAFDLYTGNGPISRRATQIQQAAIAIAVQDRLLRAGISPIDQARLFAPPTFAFKSADPNATSGPASADDYLTGTFMIGFALTIALFMAIILYGQWVAYSVVEEKASRVMEVVLAAASPFQLLAGKVIGVGALALLQYLIVLLPTVAAILFQGQIAGFVLGSGGGGVSLPEGISIPLLLAFGVMLVLGFGLYSVLYAGAAALVSRQEDINQIVAPLTLVSTAGYLVATYAGTGLIPIDSPLVVVLSYIPFFSPYLMLSRVGMGTASPLELVIAGVLLLVTIPAALWVAARLYRSGVLMYGQRPTPRTFLRALRAR